MCRQKSNFPTRKLCVSSFAELWSHARCEAGEVFRGCYRLPTLRLLHCCPAGLLQPTEAGRRMEDLWPRLASPASLLSPDSREADRGCGGSATAAAPTASIVLIWLEAVLCQRGQARPRIFMPPRGLQPLSLAATNRNLRKESEAAAWARPGLTALSVPARRTPTLCSSFLMQSLGCCYEWPLSLSLANLSSNMAPPTFAEAWQPVTIDPGSLGDLLWDERSDFGSSF